MIQLYIKRQKAWLLVLHLPQYLPCEFALGLTGPLPQSPQMNMWPYERYNTHESALPTIEYHLNMQIYSCELNNGQM